MGGGDTWPYTAGVFRRVLIATALVAVLAACGRTLPARVDPPPSGEPAEIGVAYAGTTSCLLPFELGGMWWTFDQPIDHIPPDIETPPFPFSIWANISQAGYAIPGIVTLSTPNIAVFRADSDGSQFTLTGTRVYKDPEWGCL